MEDFWIILLLSLVLAALIAVIVMLAVLLSRRGRSEDDLRSLRGVIDGSDKRMMDEFSRNRRELSDKVDRVDDMLDRGLHKIIQTQKEQSENMLSQMNRQTKDVNDTLSRSVKDLQTSNEQRLDQMRQVVDEKLTATLRERLDSSFKQVGEQLENVYKSMGEMQKLAGGVNDLQRVLTNVKARGTWAEVQLGNILEQTLTENQFVRNASIKNNGERVEFAVKIPSREEDGQTVLLPIDSKFPQEDYIRLQEAAEAGDRDRVDECVKGLERAILLFSGKISKLYIDVPRTTDFAILFLPTEGLYAEVLRIPGLVERVQNENRIMITGPTTITAFLNTLNVGFRTIAIDKKAAEVWKILSAVRAQYDKFAVALDKAKKKIGEAEKAIDDASSRSTQIVKKLKSVETLDGDESDKTLELYAADVSDETDFSE